MSVRSVSLRMGRTQRSRAWRAATVAILWAASGAGAQVCGTPDVKPAGASPRPQPTVAAVSDEISGMSLAEQEKLIRKIRLKYLGSISKPELRQIGIAKIRQFTDPLMFPKMLEIFKRDKQDIRTAILDHFSDQKSEEGDATLAWAAVFEQDAWYRAEASKRLIARVEALRTAGRARRVQEAQALPAPAATPPSTAPASTPANTQAAATTPIAQPAKNILIDPDVPWRVKKVLSNGVQQADDTIAGGAADLAGDLNLFEMIPLLINTQVGGGGGGGGTGGEDGALAFIVVGTQQAFVSDLTPVVGDSAVGFDPTVSVLNSGTVLRIDGAVVTTYRTIINVPLRRLANAAWDGRKTDLFGFDQRQWANWYIRELLPYRQQLAASTILPPK